MPGCIAVWHEAIGVLEAPQLPATSFPHQTPLQAAGQDCAATRSCNSLGIGVAMPKMVKTIFLHLQGRVVSFIGAILYY